MRKKLYGIKFLLYPLARSAHKLNMIIVNQPTEVQYQNRNPIRRYKNKISRLTAEKQDQYF